jgi:hypothetical protein
MGDVCGREPTNERTNSLAHLLLHSLDFVFGFTGGRALRIRSTIYCAPTALYLARVRGHEMATELPQICGCHEMKDKTQLEKRQKIKKKEKTELEEETETGPVGLTWALSTYSAHIGPSRQGSA